MKKIFFALILFVLLSNLALAHYEDNGAYFSTSSEGKWQMPMQNMMGGFNNQMMNSWYSGSALWGILGFVWMLIFLALPVMLFLILVLIVIKLFKSLKNK